jgi:hypothetical protein
MRVFLLRLKNDPRLGFAPGANRADFFDDPLDTWITVHDRL